RACTTTPALMCLGESWCAVWNLSSRLKSRWIPTSSSKLACVKNSTTSKNSREKLPLSSAISPLTWWAKQCTPTAKISRSWVMRHSWLRSSASKKPAQSRRWKKNLPLLRVRSAAIQIPALLHAAATPPATPPLALARRIPAVASPAIVDVAAVAAAAAAPMQRTLVTTAKVAIAKVAIAKITIRATIKARTKRRVPHSLRLSKGLKLENPSRARAKTVTTTVETTSQATLSPPTVGGVAVDVAGETVTGHATKTTADPVPAQQTPALKARRKSSLNPGASAAI